GPGSRVRDLGFDVRRLQLDTASTTGDRSGYERCEGNEITTGSAGRLRPSVARHGPRWRLVPRPRPTAVRHRAVGGLAVRGRWLAPGRALQGHGRIRNVDGPRRAAPSVRVRRGREDGRARALRLVAMGALRCRWLVGTDGNGGAGLQARFDERADRHGVPRGRAVDHDDA